MYIFVIFFLTFITLQAILFNVNVKTLTDIGLNETQAKVYLLLIKNGSLTPPQTSTSLGIKRTNAYAVLDQLEELGLATKKEVQKKITYWAENPIALEKLAKNKRAEALEHEKLVQTSMPTLLNYFYTYTDQPGVRFFQAIEGIKEIYNDMLRTGKDIYVIRSPHDQDLMSNEFFTKFKDKKSKLNINTYMINSQENREIYNDKTDKLYKTCRTQVNPDQYSANVEISTYGDKVSIISFGEEAIGMIIDSPQIAEANRQIFNLARSGAESTTKKKSR